MPIPTVTALPTTPIVDRRSDGRPSVVVNPVGLRLSYAYDAASQRKYLIEPEGARFTYTFDADGRTNYVANPQGQRATWSYDAASRVTGIHYANTTRTSYLYDNASQLLRVANLNSTSTTLSSFSYALDGVGNRLRVVESTGNRVTWSYDKTYQLKNEQRSGSNSYNITYTYDPVGNRLILINGGVPTTSTYDAANELSTSNAFSVGVTTYTSDANGNLLTSLNPSGQRITNTWDFENRLTQVALPSAIVDTFTYNGDGQRVQKIDSTGTTKHVWDGQNILLETNASNIIQVVYTLQPTFFGNLISQWRSGIGSFYLFDRLGSTTQLADGAGSVTDSYLYDSWGDIVLANGSTNNAFRYVRCFGYYSDVDISDLSVRARTYSPLLGRFLSKEPHRTLPSGIGPYSYGRNNPVGLIDPAGLFAIAPVYSINSCWAQCMLAEHFEHHWPFLKGCLDCWKIGTASFLGGCVVRCILAGPAGYVVCLGGCFTAVGIGSSIFAAACALTYAHAMTGAAIGCTIGCYWD